MVCCGGIRVLKQLVMSDREIRYLLMYRMRSFLYMGGVHGATPEGIHSASAWIWRMNQFARDKAFGGLVSSWDELAPSRLRDVNALLGMTGRNPDQFPSAGKFVLDTGVGPAKDDRIEE